MRQFEVEVHNKSKEHKHVFRCPQCQQSIYEQIHSRQASSQKKVPERFSIRCLLLRGLQRRIAVRWACKLTWKATTYILRRLWRYKIKLLLDSHICNICKGILMDAGARRFLYQQIFWLGIYFAISIVVTIFIDFPYSLMVLLPIIFGMAYYRRYRFMKQVGQQGSLFGNPFGQKEVSINYYCINCGAKHNKVSCPKCGSKMKKAGF